MALWRGTFRIVSTLEESAWGLYNRPQERRRLRNVTGHWHPETNAGILVGGKEIPAPYVVCNADFPYAITRLVEEPAVRGKYTPRKIDAMDYSCSCLVFYWGVRGRCEQLAAHDCFTRRGYTSAQTRAQCLAQARQLVAQAL